MLPWMALRSKSSELLRFSMPFTLKMCRVCRLVDGSSSLLFLGGACNCGGSVLASGRMSCHSKWWTRSLAASPGARYFAGSGSARRNQVCPSSGQCRSTPRCWSGPESYRKQSPTSP
eukprot:7175435-Pyramimonas_sp.AAC.1